MPDLSPNGNCLGVALIDAWKLVKANAPQIDLAALASTSDAVKALASVRVPQVLIRQGGTWLERSLVMLSARRLGLQSRSRLNDERLVILCLRSVRQLYGINDWARHWIVLEAHGSSVDVYDRLIPEVKRELNVYEAAPGEAILRQWGPSLIV